MDGVQKVWMEESGIPFYKLQAEHSRQKLNNMSPLYTQTKLCAKFPEMTEVITVVSETVNCIRSKGINNRQFLDFLNDMESAYGDIYYCMEAH